MSTDDRSDPRRTDSLLGQCYQQHYARVMKQVQPKLLGHVSIEVLDGIESFALNNPDSQVAQIRDDMLTAIGPHAPAGDPEAIKRFSDLYKTASDTVFPATAAFLNVCHFLNEYSSSHSLSAIDLKTLRAIDLEAHCDRVLDELMQELRSRLEKAPDIDEVTAYSQVFEAYGEVIAYRFLRERMPTEKVRERKGQQTPDFRCRPEGSRPFYVEVKTFDIVGGQPRNRAMMDDALESKVHLEKQMRAGKAVAHAVTEVAPYRKSGETDGYDSYSLIRVIETLHDKALQCFKQGQFKDGPTLALAVTDRLPLMSGPFDLAPYYYSDSNDGGIASGVLWHMAYGRPGTPILRLPEFAGAGSLEDHLNRVGLFVDETRPFPGPGLVVLHREGSGHRAFGLVNESYAEHGWSIDDTERLLTTVCHRWNDQDGSRSWDICADIRKSGRKAPLGHE